MNTIESKMYLMINAIDLFMEVDSLNKNVLIAECSSQFLVLWLANKLIRTSFCQFWCVVCTYVLLSLHTT